MSEGKTRLVYLVVLWRALSGVRRPSYCVLMSYPAGRESANWLWGEEPWWRVCSTDFVVVVVSVVLTTDLSAAVPPSCHCRQDSTALGMRRTLSGEERERLSIASGYQRRLTAMLHATISLQWAIDALTSPAVVYQGLSFWRHKFNSDYIYPIASLSHLLSCPFEVQCMTIFGIRIPL